MTPARAFDFAQLIKIVLSLFKLIVYYTHVMYSLTTGTMYDNHMTTLNLNIKHTSTGKEQ